MPDALPLALMSMRLTLNRPTGLSPHEVLMGRPMLTPLVPLPPFSQVELLLGNEKALHYYKALCAQLKYLHTQVRLAQLHPPDGVTFQVLLMTDTAVSCQGKSTWIHAFHCQQARIPTDAGPK